MLVKHGSSFSLPLADKSKSESTYKGYTPSRSSTSTQAHQPSCCSLDNSSSAENAPMAAQAMLCSIVKCYNWVLTATIIKIITRLVEGEGPYKTNRTVSRKGRIIVKPRVPLSLNKVDSPVPSKTLVCF